MNSNYTLPNDESLINALKRLPEDKMPSESCELAIFKMAKAQQRVLQRRRWVKRIVWSVASVACVAIAFLMLNTTPSVVEVNYDIEQICLESLPSDLVALSDGSAFENTEEIEDPSELVLERWFAVID